MDTGRAVAGGWGGGLALVLVAVCTWTDLRSGKIPNAVTLPFAVCGLLLAGLSAGATGAKGSFLGMLVGFAVFLIPYVAGGMGGGDVKLMASVGALVGFPHIAYVILYTAVAGGVIALAVSAWRRQVGHTLRSTWRVVLHVILGLTRLQAGDRPRPAELMAGHRSVGSIPYAAAVAVGTSAYLLFGWVA